MESLEALRQRTRSSYDLRTNLTELLNRQAPKPETPVFTEMREALAKQQRYYAYAIDQAHARDRGLRHLEKQWAWPLLKAEHIIRQNLMPRIGRLFGR